MTASRWYGFDKAGDYDRGHDKEIGNMRLHVFVSLLSWSGSFKIRTM